MTRRVAVVVLAWLALAGGSPALPDPVPWATDANGRMGVILGGEGGDRMRGAKLYAGRCAGCHEHGTGLAPSRAALGSDTRAFIVATLASGVMMPMAKGLSAHEVASVAAFLSLREGGIASGASEAPRCAGRTPPLDPSTQAQWNGWGVTPSQARFQPHPGLSAADVPRLRLRWAFAYPNSRNGQATVIGDRLFLNSSAGAIYALDAKRGCLYWRFDAPAASRGTIVAGTLPDGRHAIYFTDYSKSAVALDADSGAVIWRTKVDDQREVQMTGSPTLADGRLFVPISSAEEAIAEDPDYECCKFRGAVAALDAVTGRMLWKTTVLPAPATPFKVNSIGHRMWGPAGGAIWSAPTVDPVRHLVYVGTGDAYTDIDFPNSDAIMAIDEVTGRVRWSHQFEKGDTYIVGCYGTAGPNCPTDPGPDHDFGASPILRTLPDGQDVLLAGQKSGSVYALDPATGRVVWSRRLSPGGSLGGVEFGPAADEAHIYVPISDIYVPPGATPEPGLTALRIADGATMWSAHTPRLACAWRNVYCGPWMSQAVSAIPGVVFGASMDGRLRAFDAGTGRVTWQYDTTRPVVTVSGRQATGGVMDGAGPTIAGGLVYVNSGYQGRSGTPGTVLMAFGVDARSNARRP